MHGSQRLLSQLGPKRRYSLRRMPLWRCQSASVVGFGPHPRLAEPRVLRELHQLPYMASQAAAIELVEATHAPVMRVLHQLHRKSRLSAPPARLGPLAGPLAGHRRPRLWRAARPRGPWPRGPQPPGPRSRRWWPLDPPLRFRPRSRPRHQRLHQSLAPSAQSDSEGGPPLVRSTRQTSGCADLHVKQLALKELARCEGYFRGHQLQLLQSREEPAPAQAQECLAGAAWWERSRRGRSPAAEAASRSMARAAATDCARPARSDHYPGSRLLYAAPAPVVAQATALRQRPAQPVFPQTAPQGCRLRWSCASCCTPAAAASRKKEPMPARQAFLP